MITIQSGGSFRKTEAFLNSVSRGTAFAILDYYGQVGVDALANATPVDSGLTAASWSYEVVRKNGRYSIVWHNTNVNNGIPVAILIQYGHATGNGAWIEGVDYINPAIRPIFDRITTEVWEKVRNA